MNINEWFDVKDKNHVNAYEHLQRTGVWPIGFIPENIEFCTGWISILHTQFTDAWIESFGKQRTREEEIEAFERMISNDYKNMEKIEKSGENYMHSRTNTAFWVWLARAELDR